MFAHALLDSGAFAIAFRDMRFSAEDDKYLRYVYGRVPTWF
jgi:hypothetical protein